MKNHEAADGLQRRSNREYPHPVLLLKRFGVLTATTTCFLAALTSSGAVFTIQSPPDASPGSTVTLPITFNSFSAGAGIQFSVTWTPGILEYQSATYNLVPQGAGSALVNDTLTGAGHLGIIYDNGAAFGTDDQRTLVTLSFQAVQPGISTIYFDDTPNQRELTDNSGDPIAGPHQWNPDSANPGSITVVPEPVNLALGLFAGLAIVGTAVRKYVHWN